MCIRDSFGQVPALVQHRQAHDVPVHVQAAYGGGLEDPTGRQPGPRAQRVEPKVSPGGGPTDRGGAVGGVGPGRSGKVVDCLRGCHVCLHGQSGSEQALLGQRRRAARGFRPAAQPRFLSYLRARLADQTRPDQTRPDQTRPDQTRPDQTRPEGAYRSVAAHNLTRAEAGERARLITVQSNTVELDVTDGAGAPGAAIFRSISTIRFGCREPGAATFVDLTAPAVPEVTLNGRSLDPDLVFDGFRVAVDGLAADNELRVVADGAYMRSGEGLHRFVDPVDGEVYLYTQFETFDAHRIYACFDQPDLKAVFDLTVTAPAGWHVVSNGAATATPGPAAAQVVRFAPTPRISTYITALVAGRYHRVTDEHDGIPLGIYCRRSLAEHIDAERIFTETKRGFDYRYPFGKYDQLFVPEFNAGAMENAAAVTFLEDYVFRSKVTRASYERRAETILHEMAHMWFGDLVTMRWWDDLWLNESFATYMSVLAQVEATEYTTAWTTFANLEKTWAYRQDQLPSTHPIAADMTDVAAVRVNFDGITYAKGASVLKQLVAWVGRDEFLAGVRGYFRRYAYGNTTLADLLAELEAASGRDLTSWSKEWLQTAGVNTLRPQFDVGPDGDFGEH